MKKFISGKANLILLLLVILSSLFLPNKNSTSTQIRKVSPHNLNKIASNLNTLQTGEVLGTASATFTISGTIFTDTNLNGTQNAGESGYQGVTMTLSGASSSATVTNAGGNYTFPNLLAGNYTVSITVPPNYKNTTSQPQNVTIVASNQTLNFGIAQVFTLSGNIYLDANLNGIKDAGEGGYQGVYVKLSGTSSGLTTTDASGNYTFPNIYAGADTVSITLPTGYKNTTITSQSVTLGPNQTANFGIAQAYTITGKVFNDCNYNGTLDSGENGYQGAGISISGASSGTTNTDSNGNYSFSFLPGSYTASIVVPQNYRNTTSTSQSLTIGPNQSANFGIGVVNTISGIAYDDRNRNGVQDPGEAIYTGITVTLSGPSSASTTTNSNGYYSFANLTQGTYTVTFTVPSKHINTTAITQTVTIGAACSGGSSPGNTVNFGIVPIYTLSGKVFIDTNSNGQIDAGENPYQGVTITLSGDANGSTTSDVNGNYTFANEYEGSYTIAMQNPSGYRSTTGNSINLTLNSDQTMNFGILPSSVTTVGGRCNGNTADMVIVFDHSGSMSAADPATGNPKLNEARTAAEQFVNNMGTLVPNVQIGLVQMSGSQNYPNNPSVTGVVTNLTSNLSSVNTAINNLSLSAANGTCFDCAIAMANNMLSAGRANAQKVVVFMTDGLSNTDISYNGVYCDSPNTCNGIGWQTYQSNSENAAMAAAIQGINTSNTVFNTIGIGDPTNNTNLNQSFLQQVAATNGGIYYNDPNNGGLQVVYQNLISNTTGTGSINGTVFNDLNANGVKDAGEAAIPNWQIKAISTEFATPVSTASAANGNYSLSNLCTGNYTISQSLNTPWVPTTRSSYNVDVISGNSYNNINFGDIYGYTVSGSIFNDTNKNKIKDNGEQNYPGGASITAAKGNITVNADGTYTISGLPAGTYAISYGSQLPIGYNFIYPKNGPPPSFLVTVGGACNVPDKTTGGSCDAGGNVINLNYAISNSTPWSQTYNFDVRNDNGVTDAIPSGTTCTPYASVKNSQATNPGIIYSGDGSYNFGQGQASTTNWIVGGAVYPETYSQSSSNLRTSYSSLYTLAQHASLTITDMSTLSGCTTLSNCTLPAALPNGIYRAQGNVTLNTYSFPNSKNYIFLINGDLTVNGSLIVPVGSTALFSASGNIFIDKSVKAASDTCPVPTGQIQGSFIAGQNFTVQGINDCTVSKDNMLNIDGSVVVNANGNGGTFINQRDLCSNNLNYPAVSINPRPDFVLNAPSFLTQQNNFFMEQAP